jgi:hypothetical protein
MKFRVLAEQCLSGSFVPFSRARRPPVHRYPVPYRKVAFLVAALCTLVSLLRPPTVESRSERVLCCWSVYYVQNKTFHPNDAGFSGFNSHVNYNELLWDPFEPSLIMQLTLCNSSNSCYPYTYSYSGFLQDTRSISYGRAKCHSKATNYIDAFVYHCYASN